LDFPTSLLQNFKDTNLDKKVKRKSKKLTVKKRKPIVDKSTKKNFSF